MNAPLDMGAFIAPKSNQLNADDLISGPLTIRVTKVTASNESAEQPVAVFYEGDNGKPYLPCKTCRRVMVAVWGRDASVYPGRSMTLYRDSKVTFGGIAVGGIRISHMSDMPEAMTLAITMSKAKRAPMTIKPLATQQRQAPAPEQHDAQTGELPPIDKAAQWADATLAAIAATADRAALAELQQASQKALAKLSAQRPELSELVSMAFVERLGVFSAGDVVEPEFDDAPF